MKKIIVCAATLIFIGSSVFADFVPPQLRLSAPDAIYYDFVGSPLNIDVTVSGTSAQLVFLVYTKDKAEQMVNIQNGYLGWHLINRVDTCVYLSDVKNFPVGTTTLVWDGKENCGRKATGLGLVPAGEYTYYLWGYDAVHPKIQATSTKLAPRMQRCMTILEKDELGIPAPHPLLHVNNGSRGPIHKWVLGYEPADNTLCETTSIQGTIPAGWTQGMYECFEPTDRNIFYSGWKDIVDGYQGYYKYMWVPNGVSVKDPLWGEDIKIKCDPAETVQAGIVTDGKYMYSCVEAGVAGSPIFRNDFLVIGYDGQIVDTINMTAENERRGFGAGSGVYMEAEHFAIRQNQIFLYRAQRMYIEIAGCYRGLVDYYRYDSSGDIDDFYVWGNGNGDYIGDQSFQIDAPNPWSCSGIEPGGKPGMSQIAVDANNFSSSVISYSGALSFNLFGPDGTGIGNFGYAGEVNGLKMAMGICDAGSAYDGLYSDNLTPVGVTEQLPEGDPRTLGVMFCAQDSFKGIITSNISEYITLLSPNGGEKWARGSGHDIKWYSFGIGNITIEYSSDGGQSWIEIGTNVDASLGSLQWGIPLALSDLCLVRVKSVSNPALSDVSNFVFSIVAPYVTVTAPNGGEQWVQGKGRKITWSYVGIEKVKIEYSIDDKTSWVTVAESIDASVRQYVWEVPSVVSSTCDIRISNAYDSSVSDISNAPFSIIAPYIRVVGPNGGEYFEMGKTIKITWEKKGVDSISIDCSFDNGVNWKNIVWMYDGVPDSGVFSWKAPIVESTTCLVKISDSTNNSLYDISDGVFTIRAPSPLGPFTPTLLRIEAPSNIKYDFGGSELQIPVMVSGTPANVTFLVFTNGKDSSIHNVQNGYLGWHYVNKVDTCVYVSMPYQYGIGENIVTWNGRDQDGGLVAAGEYTYYMWAYDNVHEKQPVARFVNPTWDDMGIFVTHNESGMPLANPILYGGMDTSSNYNQEEWNRKRQKWFVGNDPNDYTLVETTSYRGWNEHCQVQVDPYNSNMFFTVTTDNNLVRHLRKYLWVPNGEAVLKTDWGSAGEVTWPITAAPGYWSADGPVKYAGNDILVATNTDISGVSNESELVLINAAEGTEVRRIDLSDWWIRPEDGERGGQQSSGPSDLEFRGGMLFLGSHTTCMNQVINPHDEYDWNRWVNQNGDYIGDHNFAPDSPRPWVCNDYNVGPYKYSIASDANLFSVFPSYGIGAVSFGMYAPDGTGIGYFPYAGETANVKYITQFIDYGSAYDGMYTDKRSQGEDGWWYVGHDSIRGLINPWGQSEWLATITLMEGMASTELQFGVHPQATDGIDADLGESELPPKPPAGVFDARFIGANMGCGVIKDLRNTLNSSNEYIIDIQRASGGNVTINWESLAGYAGAFFMMDTIIGTIINVDMKSTSEYTITNPGITQVKIVYYQAVWEMHLSPGWNMASLGVDVPDKSVGSIFPTKVSVFQYDQGYSLADSIRIGKGYWVKVNEAYNDMRYGGKITSQTLNLPVGWHMIGGLSGPVIVSSIVQNPNNNLISIFKFAGVYQQVTDRLMPGEGYWVHLRNSGSITLNASGEAVKGLPYKPYVTSLVEGSREIPFIMTSVYGEKKVYIYLKDGIGNSGDMASEFELPPMPPSETFDVRIASENTNGLYGIMGDGLRDFNVSIDIKVPDKDEKIRVTWDRGGLEPGKYLLSDGNMTVDMALEGGIEVTGTTRLTFRHAGSGGVVTEYQLMNNYPNPFNPSTTIGYSVKVSGRLELTVYNLLGQEVKRLVDQIHEPGTYSIVWDGTNEYGEKVSAGVYFYRLKVNEFVDTKKMLYIK